MAPGGGSGALPGVQDHGTILATVSGIPVRHVGLGSPVATQPGSRRMNDAAFGPGSRVFDVTVPIRHGLTVWPGDTPVGFEGSDRIAAGAIANISKVSLSSHCGTHVDAPWHFEDDGPKLDTIPVERWVGAAVVVAVPPGVDRITAATLDGLAIPPGTDRIVFKTRSVPRPHDAPFDEGYVAVTADGARWLLDHGIDLVGIDSPSIECFDDHAHVVHHTLLGARMLIVEGLDLTAIKPGPYLMICLPLHLAAADGAPARVLLVQNASAG